MLLVQLAYLCARYLHVVCTTLLVGGTLFYEMVVPLAIDDLKEETQLAVFAKARWVFRWIVWVSAILLITSGIATSRRHWESYKRTGEYSTMGPAGQAYPVGEVSAIERPGWWWMAHVTSGFIAVLIALSLTAGKSPPTHPVTWMRLNLVVLMIVIFLASVAQHMRLLGDEPPTTPPSATYYSATQ